MIDLSAGISIVRMYHSRLEKSLVEATRVGHVQPGYIGSVKPYRNNALFESHFDVA
jgi:hypothetical protein